jgi:hypothetical protein
VYAAECEQSSDKNEEDQCGGQDNSSEAGVVAFVLLTFGIVGTALAVLAAMGRFLRGMLTTALHDSGSWLF